MLDYKDLAALPKTKAIYNIDRPDMLSYSPYVSYPSEERHYGEVGQPHGSLSFSSTSHLSNLIMDITRYIYLSSVLNTSYIYNNIIFTAVQIKILKT